MTSVLNNLQKTHSLPTEFAVVRAGERLRTAGEWLNTFADPSSRAHLLEPLYSDHAAASAKIDPLRKMLTRFVERFGNSPVVIARAPGRLNIMGRHIDHQGGHVNMIALDRDTWVVAGPAAETTLTLTNLDSLTFQDRRIDVNSLLPGYRNQPWRQYVDEPQMMEISRAAAGDWSQYVKAAFARFLARSPELEPCGLNLVVSGDIPPAAGLSSSSALVVSTMEALCGLSGVHFPDQEFAELCGEAEWYVGTRGGSGDHAAMKFARRGQVVQIRFFPMEVTDSVDFPPNHVVLVCKSGIEARKSAGVKDVFNHRVACYHLGRELFKREHPDIADGFRYLRDMLPVNAGLSPRALLDRLEVLPESATREELSELLPPDMLAPIFSNHNEEPGPYPIRQVVRFGIAECERSRRSPELLRNAQYQEFGKWMNISHDGDRVESLAESADCGEDLARIPGSYSCSLPQIDRMADTVLNVGGVLGAQISGAGLGGCLMVLARSESVESVKAALVNEYYEPAGIEPDVFPCAPSAGSGVLE